MICMSRTQYIPTMLGKKISDDFNFNRKNSPKIYFDGDAFGAIKNFVMDARSWNFAWYERSEYDPDKVMAELKDFGFSERTFIRKKHYAQSGSIVINFNASKKLMKNYLNYFENELEEETEKLPELEKEAENYEKINGDLIKFLEYNFGVAKKLDNSRYFIKHKKEDTKFKKSFRDYYYAKAMRFEIIDSIEGYSFEITDPERIKRRARGRIDYSRQALKNRKNLIESIKKTIEFIKNL